MHSILEPCEKFLDRTLGKLIAEADGAFYVTRVYFELLDVLLMMLRNF